MSLLTLKARLPAHTVVVNRAEALATTNIANWSAGERTVGQLSSPEHRELAVTIIVSRLCQHIVGLAYPPDLQASIIARLKNRLHLLAENLNDFPLALGEIEFALKWLDQYADSKHQWQNDDPHRPRPAHERNRFYVDEVTSKLWTQLPFGAQSTIGEFFPKVSASFCDLVTLEGIMIEDIRERLCTTIIPATHRANLCQRWAAQLDTDLMGDTLFEDNRNELRDIISDLTAYGKVIDAVPEQAATPS